MIWAVFTFLDFFYEQLLRFPLLKKQKTNRLRKFFSLSNEMFFKTKSKEVILISQYCISIAKETSASRDIFQEVFPFHQTPCAGYGSSEPCRYWRSTSSTGGYMFWKFPWLLYSLFSSKVTCWYSKEPNGLSGLMKNIKGIFSQISRSLTKIWHCNALIY